MPCNRSPPPPDSGALAVPSTSVLHHSSSEPSLTEGILSNSATRNEHDSNVSLFRNAKRKLLRVDDDKMDYFMDEMRKMFSDFKEEENIKYEKLYSAVEEIRLSVEFSAQKYDALKSKVDQIESLHRDNLEYIKSLETRILGYLDTLNEARDQPA